MDPLSVAASCITVVGTGQAAIKGLKKLRTLASIPDILLSIINEVADLTLVVQDLRLSIQLHQDSTNTSQTSSSAITQLLDRAQATLLELDQVINYRLLRRPKPNGEITFSRSAWIFEEQRIQRLQENLRSTRLSISTLNFTRTLHLEVRVQQLSLMTQGVQDSLEATSRSLATTHQDALNQLLPQLRILQESQNRCQATLQNLDNRFARLIEPTLQRLMTQSSSQSTPRPNRSIDRARPPIPIQSSPMLGLQLSQATIHQCHLSCSCQCHVLRRWSSPPLLREVVGALFLGYSATPATLSPCDRTSCGRYQSSKLTVLYIFPAWFWARILLIVLSFSKRDGPVVSLRTMIIRSSNRPAFYHAQVGNLVQLRSLFQQNKASPFDITPEEDNYILAYAVDGFQPEICQYLLDEGADPHFKIGSLLSAAEIAWNSILANDGPAETLLSYKRLFSNYNDLDDRDLTIIHRIVLGLDSRDLGTYIRSYPRAEIDRCDSLGYSALHWAARRGDSENLRTLLEAKFDPNARERNDITPLHLAVRTGEFLSTNLLLEYGAEVNARDRSGASPLASYVTVGYTKNATPDNLTCLERLVGAGADVNTQDIQGATPLYYASQYGLTLVLVFLLRNGGDPNKPAFDGESALAVAVQANQYDIVPILLAYGANIAHQTLSSRSLLHEAAEYGDERMLRLLISLHIRGVQVGRRNSDGKTARDLAGERADMTEEWRLAFADLLASVDETVDEGVTESPQTSPRFSIQLNRIPRVRLSEVIKIIEDSAYELFVWVCRAITGLLQMQIPISALVVVILAILWYVLTR